MEKLNKIAKYTDSNKNVLLFLKIVANSKSNQIIEIIEHENKFYLKIKIKALALENKANKELISYLSKIFSIPKTYLSIESGETFSYKTIKIKESLLERIQEKISQNLKDE